MGVWLNTTKIIKGNLKKDKPCHKLNYCPYGCLVEEYPFEKKRTKISCTTFGHSCPMYFQAEDIIEDNIIELNKGGKK